ncbi:hypothetical protein GOODEAATRI_011048 [Goodea atripinnis]|uniref:TNF family profile domain-containing protein n=1 Tax=Goodea atripinnis TaxID=208336 RepID=A0ABV0PX12_9TELE
MSVFFPLTPHLLASPLVLKKPRSSGRELRAPMDQAMIDVEGGRAVRQRSGAGRLAAVVAVQNLLVVACLLVTVYLCMKSPALPEDDVYIQFNELRDLKANTSLKFEVSREKRRLENDKGNISISCTGPYVWHMLVCYKTMNQGNLSGNLVLQVANTPVNSVRMDAIEQTVCRGLHSIVYLKERDVASFHLYSPKGFWMVNVSMGLRYLLGNNCDY